MLRALSKGKDIFLHVSSFSVHTFRVNSRCLLSVLGCAKPVIYSAASDPFSTPPLQTVRYSIITKQDVGFRTFSHRELTFRCFVAALTCHQNPLLCRLFGIRSRTFSFCDTRSFSLLKCVYRGGDKATKSNVGVSRLHGLQCNFCMCLHFTSVFLSGTGFAIDSELIITNDYFVYENNQTCVTKPGKSA